MHLSFMLSEAFVGFLEFHVKNLTILAFLPLLFESTQRINDRALRDPMNF